LSQIPSATPNLAARRSRSPFFGTTSTTATSAGKSITTATDAPLPVDVPVCTDTNGAIRDSENDYESPPQHTERVKRRFSMSSVVSSSDSGGRGGTKWGISSMLKGVRSPKQKEKQATLEDKIALAMSMSKNPK
jgi:hypothetical protein